ncbi:MAG: Crp/Fnr family transcriptional regulator [Candidatus Eremiobacteraeota bacterium]|nr:Crp/Fnr family transcriptional regulator [Candidatus Eremiobacteraeota bacterium]
MKNQHPIVDPRVNELLAHLPSNEYDKLVAGSRIVTLKHGKLLFADKEPRDMVYFPLTALVSMIAEMDDGSRVEYGSIGREGMVGLQVALSAQPLRGRAICQLEGTVLTVDGSVIRELARFSSSPELHRLLLRYAQATINVLAQSAACNALHTVRQRCARWLLITRDRAGDNRFKLTQEFLAMMLGLPRTTVTAAAGQFQREGIIEYTRGRVTILKEKPLSKAACECYELITDEYDLVFKAAA